MVRLRIDGVVSHRVVGTRGEHDLTILFANSRRGQDHPTLFTQIQQIFRKLTHSRGLILYNALLLVERALQNSVLLLKNIEITDLLGHLLIMKLVLLSQVIEFCALVPEFTALLQGQLLLLIEVVLQIGDDELILVRLGDQLVNSFF